MNLNLELSTSPFVRTGKKTPAIMLDVNLSLIPISLASIYFFGISSLLLMLACVSGSAGSEFFINKLTKAGQKSLRDNTAVLTGLLLAFTLPPGFPLWMAFLGGIVSIFLGKWIWGGMGKNLFNPALVGRGFLQAAFPVAITTWEKPLTGFWSIPKSSLAIPLFSPQYDSLSAATPLGAFKFDGQITGISHLFWGNTAGCIGETSGLIIILAGLWLVYRKVFDWRLPLSTILTIAVLSGIFWGLNPEEYPNPLFMLFSGGAAFAIVFMVTDPVSTPITFKGAWIFGIGVGVLIVLIRLFGGLPEGVMYAILLMNAVTPIINNSTQSAPFGGRRK